MRRWLYVHCGPVFQQATPQFFICLLDYFSIPYFQSSFQQKDIQELENRQNDITKLAESLKVRGSWKKTRLITIFEKTDTF